MSPPSLPRMGFSCPTYQHKCELFYLYISNLCLNGALPSAIATSSSPARPPPAATTTASPARPPPPPPPAHVNPPSYGSGSTNRGSGYDDCVSSEKYFPPIPKTRIHRCCRVYGYLWSPTVHLYAPNGDPCCRRYRNWRYPHHHCCPHSRRPPLRALRCQCLCWRHHQICVGCKQPYCH
jgi:hypothetical protein